MLSTLKPAEKALIWLTGINVAVLIASNLLAVKIISVFGIPADAGIILYPASYVVSDLLVEFYGKARANLVVYASGLLNLSVGIALAIAVLLPAYPNWQGQSAFAEVHIFLPRVIFSSIIAYIVSGLANNLVFEQIRHRTRTSAFATRVLGSSLVARFFDIAIFETIAFAGVLSAREFFIQAAFAYVAGLGIEVALFPLVTGPVRRALHRYLHPSPR